MHFLESVEDDLLEAITALCFKGAPLGGPVEPEVYMMQHRSSLEGGVGGTMFSSPSFRSSSMLSTVRRSNLLLSWSICSCLTSVSTLYTMRSRAVADSSGLRSVGSRCGSQKMALAPAWTRECRRPSSPSVSYAVTMGIDCDVAPCVMASQLALHSGQHLHRASFSRARRTWYRQTCGVGRLCSCPTSASQLQAAGSSAHTRQSSCRCIH